MTIRQMGRATREKRPFDGFVCLRICVKAVGLNRTIEPHEMLRHFCAQRAAFETFVPFVASQMDSSFTNDRPS